MNNKDMLSPGEPEKKQPSDPEEVIARICENGPHGQWFVFENFSKQELQRIQAAMVEEIRTFGDELTQQTSPIDGRPLTYREVLGQTLVSVQQALEEK